MHELEAARIALANHPATFTEMLAALPAGELQPVPTRDNAEVQQDLDELRAGLARERLTGAKPLEGPVPGWDIEVCPGLALTLVGHLYPGPSDGEVDPASPVVVLNRMTREIYYGPEIPSIAMDVLSNTLLRDELLAAQGVELYGTPPGWAMTGHGTVSPLE